MTSSTPVPTPSERAKIVDEYGAVSLEVDRARPAVARQKVLRSQIESWFGPYADADKFVERGHLFECQISPRRWVRKIIDMPRLYRLLTRERFLSFCTFPLTALDQNTTAAEQEKLVETTQSGPRDIKPLPLRLAEVAEIQQKRAA